MGVGWIQIHNPERITGEQLDKVANFAAETTKIIGGRCGEGTALFEKTGKPVRDIAHAAEHIAVSLFEAATPKDHVIAARARNWNKTAPKVSILISEKEGAKPGSVTKVLELAVKCINLLLER